MACPLVCYYLFFISSQFSIEIGVLEMADASSISVHSTGRDFAVVVPTKLGGFDWVSAPHYDPFFFLSFFFFFFFIFIVVVVVGLVSLFISIWMSALENSPPKRVRNALGL